MLIKIRVSGKFYHAIRALYSAPKACVRVNETLTNCFPTPSGVKQGDALSPNLFAVYINDLAVKIKSLQCGVQYLQKMLTCAERWCNQWRMTINEKKTEIMHFRNPRTTISEFHAWSLLYYCLFASFVLLCQAVFFVLLWVLIYFYLVSYNSFVGWATVVARHVNSSFIHSFIHSS
uniref:Uncharacterized protein n=1 Tax=Myripristis murdjan TaxID=586833 RepID=A0A667YVB4_9TELE